MNESSQQRLNSKWEEYDRFVRIKYRREPRGWLALLLILRLSNVEEIRDGMSVSIATFFVFGGDTIKTIGGRFFRLVGT